MAEISVVIPVYNLKIYIADMLISLMSQTFDDFEAVIIDDGSTDGSGELIRELVDGDSRFLYCRQANSGVSAARNRGMDMASGKYVVFFDGDDFIPEDSLEAMLNAIKENDCDMAVGIMKTFSDGRPVPYEDQSVLNVRYKSGIVGTVENSWLDFSDNARKTFVYGTEGTIETYAGQWGVVLHKRNGEKVYYDTGRIPGHYEPPLTKIVDIFAKCIMEDTRPLCTSREGLHCLQIINAAYESQKTNTWTKVED